MAKDYSQVNFRIPTKLKEDIEKAALDNERSITSELVARLEESFNHNENTRTLIQDAVVLAIKAIQEDPNLLKNTKVTVAMQNTTEDEKDRISVIKKYRESSSET